MASNGQSIDGGWVRLATQTTGSAVFQIGQPSPLHLWILLLSKSHRGKRPLKTAYGPIGYGEVHTSLRRLEDGLGRRKQRVHHTTIRRWLKWMSEQEMIEIRKIGQGGVIIRISNFKRFQDPASYHVSRHYKGSNTQTGDQRNTDIAQSCNTSLVSEPTNNTTETEARTNHAQHCYQSELQHKLGGSCNSHATHGRLGDIEEKKEEEEAPPSFNISPDPSPPQKPPNFNSSIISLDTKRRKWTGLTDADLDHIRADLRDDYPEVDDPGVLDRGLRDGAAYWCDAIADGQLHGGLQNPRAAIKKGIRVYITRCKKKKKLIGKEKKEERKHHVDPLAHRFLAEYRNQWSVHHRGVDAPTTRNDGKHAAKCAQILRGTNSKADDDTLLNAFIECLERWFGQRCSNEHPIGFLPSRLPGLLTSEE